MIGYVTLGTSNLARAAAFYDAIAAELDTPRMMEFDGFIAWGKPGGAAGIGLCKPHDETAGEVQVIFCEQSRWIKVTFQRSVILIHVLELSHCPLLLMISYKTEML